MDTTIDGHRTDKHQALIDYLTNSEAALYDLHLMGLKFLDDKFVWKILIYKLDHADIPSEVLWHRLSQQEIVEMVIDYFKECGTPIKEVTLDVSLIPDELTNDLIKARVKFKGEVWTIHKNDQDSFPSNPHAHNYDKQYKLHLGNGRLFRNKTQVGKVSKKNLILLRQRILHHIDIKLPEL